jgi:hypothetical protein
MSETSILDGNPTCNAYELAALFTNYSGQSKGGPRYVDASRIRYWYHNRERYGFPEVCGTRQSGGPPARVWNAAEALEWFKNFEPPKGGAPRGNRHAVKHGQYIGLRAEREKRRQESSR